MCVLGRIANEVVAEFLRLSAPIFTKLNIWIFNVLRALGDTRESERTNVKYEPIKGPNQILFFKRKKKKKIVSSTGSHLMRFSRPLYLPSYYVERPAVYTDKRKTFSKNWIFKFNRIFFSFFLPKSFEKKSQGRDSFLFYCYDSSELQQLFVSIKKERKKNTAGLTSFLII